jgi:polyisoprenoid-binding protein YceI
MSKLPRPRSIRAWIITGACGAVAAAVAAFVIVYLTQFGGSNVAPLSLSTGTSSSAKPTLTKSELAGTWTIASGSVAGYRVREQLAFLQSPSDAVGRTSQVSGGMTVSGQNGSLVVTAANFTVNVASLTSDMSMRDQRIHELGLQSDMYPTSTFVLTSPITLPASVASGAEFSASATGRLTIHGDTQTVTIPVTARLSGAQVEIVGSISFPFEKFGMQVPNVDGFVSVVDSATMEFDLHLQHS